MRQKYVCIDVECDRRKKCRAPVTHHRGSNGGAESNGVGATAKEARREAYRAGWVRSNGKDFCPYCDAHARGLVLQPPMNATLRLEG